MINIYCQFNLQLFKISLLFNILTDCILIDLIKLEDIYLDLMLSGENE
jgi:hypothetical protein